VKRKRPCSIWCVRWGKATSLRALLEMLQVLDDMRCDWMEILQHGLPELERGQAQARTPKLVKKCDF
jgi:hypothetical protein